MKKLFFISIALIALVLIFNPLSQDYSLSDLQLTNIEALSSHIEEPDEGGEGEVVKCYCKMNWFSPNVCSANADGPYCGEDPCSNHDGNCR